MKTVPSCASLRGREVFPCCFRVTDLFLTSFVSLVDPEIATLQGISKWFSTCVVYDIYISSYACLLYNTNYAKWLSEELPGQVTE